MKYHRKQLQWEAFQIMKKKNDQKTLLVQQLYSLNEEYQEDAGETVLLTISLMKPIGNYNNLRSYIKIEQYSSLKKKTVFTHNLKFEEFRFKNSINKPIQKVTDRVYYILSAIQYSGDPNYDFRTQFKRLMGLKPQKVEEPPQVQQIEILEDKSSHKVTLQFVQYEQIETKFIIDNQEFYSPQKADFEFEAAHFNQEKLRSSGYIVSVNDYQWALRRHQEEVAKKKQQQSRQKRGLELAKAYLLGFLARRQYGPFLSNKICQLKGTSKRTLQGNLCQFFLYQKKKMKSLQSTFYKVKIIKHDINQQTFYDIKLSLEMIIKIFTREGITDEELNDLITYDKNEKEFKMMLECFEFTNDDEFILNFKKFKNLLNAKQEDQIVKNDMENKGKEKENIGKKEVVTDRLPLGRDLKPTSQQPKKEMSKKKQSFLNLQALIRGYLTREQKSLLTQKNFKNQNKSEHLALYERGTWKICNIYFNYFLYTTSTKQNVMFTLRTALSKQKIVQLREIRLDEFDNEADLQDIPQYIKEKLEEQVTQLKVELKEGKITNEQIKELQDAIQTHI